MLDHFDVVKLSFVSKLRFYMRYLWRTLRLCSFVSTRSTIGSRHVILCLKCCLSTACLIHSLRLSASSSSKVCIVTKRENCTLLLFFFTDERSTFLLSCSICDFFCTTTSCACILPIVVKVCAKIKTRFLHHHNFIIDIITTQVLHYTKNSAVRASLLRAL